MFKLKKIPDVTLEVPIDVPGDHGKSSRHTIRVKYRLLSVTEQKEVFEAPDHQRPTDDALMARDVLDILDVKDEAGEPMAYSEELLEQMMDIPYVRASLVKGWLRAQAGAPESAEKNSARLGGTMRA